MTQSILNIKQCLKDIRSVVYGEFYHIRWKLRYENNGLLLNTEQRKIPIIVSLTSFPERILIVSKTLKSILMQEGIRPDAIQLWLAKEQFPNGYESLPSNLKKLESYGVEIKWCEDLKSYKKFVPCYRENENAIIVTTDDDVYYSKYWLKKLYDAYLLNPKVIHCHKVTQFYMKNGEYKTKNGGRHYYPFPSFLNKLVGVGGVLYPPGTLHKDVTIKELFKGLAPTNDDIWFWLMGVLQGSKVSVVCTNEPKPIEVYEHVKSSKLTTINDDGENLFWIQFRKIITQYPMIDRILKEAYRELDNIS